MPSTALTGRSVLWSSIRDHRGDLAIAAAFLIGHQTGEALVPMLVGVVIDRALTTGDPSALLGWLLVLAADFAVLSFCYRWGARRSWRADLHADQRLRLRLAERILHPAGGAEAGRLPGELTNIAVVDAKRVGLMNFALPLGMSAVAAVLVAAIGLLRISVPLGLLVLLGGPPLLYLVHLLGKPLERRSGPEQERAARASGVAADLVEGIRVLKGIGAEPAAVRRYREISQTALGATLRATTAHAWYQGAVLAANGLFLAVVALVSGRLAATGAITVGELVAAVGLAQFLLTPLSIFGWVNGRIARARAAAARIAEVLASPKAVRAGERGLPDPVRGAVRIRGLAYGPLNGLDLDLHPGEFLGVVTADAPSDTGSAAALLRCLGREVEPDGGTLELDGIPWLALHPTALRSGVLVAPHDAALFAGSVWENVTAGADAQPAARVTSAVAAARADQVAEALPEGLASPVGERGHLLSGGQRQRVALARALAADPPVLVLHDPTTAVDAVTEAEIAARLRALRHGRTTVLVTTSPALLEVTDRVALLAGGRCAASGSHRELVRENPTYRAAVLS